MTFLVSTLLLPKRYFDITLSNRHFYIRTVKLIFSLSNWHFDISTFNLTFWHFHYQAGILTFSHFHYQSDILTFTNWYLHCQTDISTVRLTFWHFRYQAGILTFSLSTLLLPKRYFDVYTVKFNIGILTFRLTNRHCFHIFTAKPTL